MKKFLYFCLFMCCTSLNACNELELNSLLEKQGWTTLIPKVREAFKKKDTQTLGWIKKVGASPYVPLMYESMRNAVKKAQSEKKLQKLLSITIIAHITTILDLLSCEELKYMNSQEQERTYQHIKENFRHRLYYKAPVLQQYWKANMQHEDFKFQYSHVILDAKKTYENFLKKNINFPSPIWAVNVANTSFLKLTYWIDFGTPSQEIFNNSKKSESLETIKNIREKNTKIIWAFFSTISDWENFFMLTWQDIITYINEKKNTFWLSLILEENSPEIIVK